MSASFFAKILPILMLPAAAHAELSLEQELLSSYDEVTHALKGQPTLSCDLSDPGPLDPNRPKVRIRSKNPIFNQVPGFALTLEGPFPSWGNSISGKPASGKLSYNTFAGRPVEIPVDLVPRGRLRQQCALPPFKIVLPKKPPGAVFGNSDRDLKVVTACAFPPTPENNERLLLEYAIYRIVEASGAYALLTQLVDVTYKNAKGEVIARAPAILLENPKDTRKRIMGTTQKPKDAPWIPKVSNDLIEELIENNDYDLNTEPERPQWSDEKADVVVAHNLYLLRHPTQNYKITVPYDFDLSGLVLGGHVGWNPRTDYSDLSRWEGMNHPTLIANEGAMLRAIEETPLSPESKEHLSNRIRQVIQAMKRPKRR